MTQKITKRIMFEGLLQTVAGQTVGQTVVWSLFGWTRLNLILLGLTTVTSFCRFCIIRSLFAGA